LNGSGEIEWKELNTALCRVMQNYCSEYKNDELLKLGLIWLEDLRKNEGSRVCTDNPHKLIRTLEVFNIFTCSEMIIHASMARKASSQWHKWVTIKMKDGKIKSDQLPIDFWEPLVENYEKHR